MEERNSTLVVLLDIGAARRNTDEQLAALTEAGILRATAVDIPDGLHPSLAPISSAATAAIFREPTWSNTLYASVMQAITSKNERGELRAHLLEVASTVVNWIEVLDERNKNG